MMKEFKFWGELSIYCFNCNPKFEGKKGVTKLYITLMRQPGVFALIESCAVMTGKFSPIDLPTSTQWLNAAWTEYCVANTRLIDSLSVWQVYSQLNNHPLLVYSYTFDRPRHIRRKHLKCMHEIKNETWWSSKLSPQPQKKRQNSDEKYLTVLETANRTAGEEMVNIWLSSWETNSANICYVLQAVVIIVFKDV